ncbi:MAG: bacteriocin [Erysipelotrichaceae bacterium]
MEENKKNELNDEELDEVNGGLFIVNKLFGNKNVKKGTKTVKPGLINDGLMINDSKNSNGRII